MFNNKKKLLKLLLFVLLQVVCNQPTNHKNESKSVSMQTIKYINDWELPQDLKDVWNVLFKDFLDNKFLPELAKRKLQQDCKMCGDIFYEYQFSINENGQMIEALKIRESVDCPNVSIDKISGLESIIIKYFEEKTFPYSLRGLHLKVKIGRVTKC